MVLRKLTAYVMIAGLFATGAMAQTAFSDPPPESLGIAEQARLGSLWRSLDLTARTLAAGPIPGSWDAGSFLDFETLDTAFGEIAGTTLRRSGQGLLSGTSVTVKSVRLKPDTGTLGAELDIWAEKAGFRLPLKIAANVTFQGVSENPAGTSSFLTLRVEPMAITASSDGSLLDLAERGFMSAVIPDLLVLFADPHLFEVRIPLPNRVDFALGLQKTQTISVNGGSGSVAIAVEMEKGAIAQDIAYDGVVFGRKGVWLLARLAENVRSDGHTGDPPAALPELKADVERLRGVVVADLDHASAPDSAAVHLGKSTLLALAEKLRSIDPAQRRVTFKSVGKNGNLAGKRQSLGILGNLGVQASLLDAGAALGSVQIEFGRASWNQKSLTLPVSADLDAAAKIELNVDVIASGVVRTSVGLVGHGSGAMTAVARPVIAGTDQRRVAAIEFPGSCATVQADIKTDGVLKGDLGVVKVPSIGGRISSSFGPLPPVLVLDGRPHLVHLPTRKFGDWSFEPPHSALAVSLLPRAFTASDEGLDLAVNLVSAPIGTDGSPAGLDPEAEGRAVRLQVEQVSAATTTALGELASPHCAASSDFALLIGDIEFGSNNDIVRLLVQIGKLPKEAVETVEHLGHEVSADKIKGWVDDPGGSLKRGEFGKIAGQVTDAARRGALGRALRGKWP
jgi:hypothetical protein